MSRTRWPSASEPPLILPDWAAVYADLPEGYDAPEEDRSAVDRAAGDRASAYGELPPESAERLLRWLAPTPQDALFDLGSGTGRLVAQAVCTTAVGLAVGVELSRFRHRVALTARDRLLERLDVAAAAELRRRLVLRCEDLRHTDLVRATIVYAGSTCYPDPLLDALAERAAAAPHLRALVSARPLPWPHDPRLEEVGRIRLPMSWSRSERVAVYRPR